jgi:peptide/nickel transport system substrate-binding protein
VRFHNGETLTSADVLASWERYKSLSPGGKALADVAGLAAPDALTFVVTLSRPKPLFLESIVSPTYPMSIMPAAEAAKGRGEITPIGTGPYQFVELVPDDRVVLRRFDGYSVDETQPEGFNGYAGRRVANVESIVFRVIPEAGTRTAALETGEVTITSNLPIPTVRRLTAEGTGFVNQQVLPFAKSAVVLNTSNGITSNLLIRQAIQAAMNSTEIMEISQEGFYGSDPSLIFSTSPYYAGADIAAFYDQNDIAKARTLMTEAGYAGEPLKILANSDNPASQAAALVLNEQLVAAGFKAEVTMADLAANVAALTDGTGDWNVVPQAYGAQPLAGPAAWFPVIRQHTRQAADPEYDKLADAWLNEADIEKRKALWRDFEHYVNEQAYFIVNGDRGLTSVSSDDLKGFKPFYSMRFWNAWLEP